MQEKEKQDKKRDFVRSNNFCSKTQNNSVSHAKISILISCIRSWFFSHWALNGDKIIVQPDQGRSSF